MKRMAASELQDGAMYWSFVAGEWRVFERDGDRIYWIADEVGAGLSEFDGDVFIGPIEPPADTPDRHRL